MIRFNAPIVKFVPGLLLLKSATVEIEFYTDNSLEVPTAILESDKACRMQIGPKGIVRGEFYLYSIESKLPANKPDLSGYAVFDKFIFASRIANQGKFRHNIVFVSTGKVEFND